MAAFLLLAPLLLLGTVSGQADTDTDGCLWLWNATEGNFSVKTTPETYQPDTTYLVTIKDDRNHSNSSGPFLLQALSPQKASVGQWEKAPTQNCSSVTTAMLNVSERAANWTSPAGTPGNLSSVQIRVYLRLPNNITELRTWMLDRAAETTPVPSNTTSTSSTTPNSAGRARGSSWLLAALLLLLPTASLLS
ncbi:uncharacterized protein VK521_013239 [Ammospiza maritima maritima]